MYKSTSNETIPLIFVGNFWWVKNQLINQPLVRKTYEGNNTINSDNDVRDGHFVYDFL